MDLLFNYERSPKGLKKNFRFHTDYNLKTIVWVLTIPINSMTAFTPNINHIGTNEPLFIPTLPLTRT
jgi:hypothetical protein